MDRRGFIGRTLAALTGIFAELVGMRAAGEDSLAEVGPPAAAPQQTVDPIEHWVDEIEKFAASRTAAPTRASSLRATELPDPLYVGHGSRADYCYRPDIEPILVAVRGKQVEQAFAWMTEVQSRLWDRLVARLLDPGQAVCLQKLAQFHDFSLRMESPVAWATIPTRAGAPLFYPNGQRVQCGADRVVTPRFVCDVDELDVDGLAAMLLAPCLVMRAVVDKITACVAKFSVAFPGQRGLLLLSLGQLKSWHKREAYMLESFAYEENSGLLFAPDACVSADAWESRYGGTATAEERQRFEQHMAEFSSLVAMELPYRCEAPAIPAERWHN